MFSFPRVNLDLDILFEHLAPKIGIAFEKHPLQSHQKQLHVEPVFFYLILNDDLYFDTFIIRFF